MDQLLSNIIPTNRTGDDGFNWWVGQVEGIALAEGNNKGGFRGDNANGGYITLSYLDSPATTSAVTYGVQTACNTGTYAINNYFGGGPTTSFLTVMEVSA